ncbi:glycosyltransferase [Salinisphaera orenii]|uniref:Glycosyl transferase family 1 domain-containing protein n=1 Tax=Salinisphaera orenii YIM 95161 TaxID=1051139 RepID=A0A423PVJ8_9GAMM|nr:glycosyltransferase [Salinisphaera halophila]ROO29627.1 hypothetical protein SAHL_08875 [Salinisphaera halophila YIM 95161]
MSNSRERPIRILHYVSLAAVGGVEHQFAQFIHHTRQRFDVSHAVVACSKRIHPHLAREIEADAEGIDFEKRLGRWKIPSRPAFLRAAHQRRIAARHRPDVALLWNRMGENWRAVRAVGGSRCIYWDRGSSWLPGEEGAKRRLLDSVGGALANSNASRRMLELRWGYTGEIRLCRNALRPNMVPAESMPRHFPDADVLHIGVAARLESIKGVVLAVHALHALNARGVAAHLHIAGTGAEEATVADLIETLGLGDRVTLHGLVRNMSAFYATVDCLLHLALREPFGAVAVEAMVHGCPVVASNVDGLPEIVVHGECGRVVQPELDLSEYRALGGRIQDLPEYVYDPGTDSIREPRAVAPEAAADAVQALFRDAATYERMSASGIRRARDVFSYEGHAACVMDAVTRFHRTGRLGG